jgi:hypothetical protein
VAVMAAGNGLGDEAEEGRGVAVGRAPMRSGLRLGEEGSFEGIKFAGLRATAPARREPDRRDSESPLSPNRDPAPRGGQGKRRVKRRARKNEFLGGTGRKAGGVGGHRPPLQRPTPVRGLKSRCAARGAPRLPCPTAGRLGARRGPIRGIGRCVRCPPGRWGRTSRCRRRPQ